MLTMGVGVAPSPKPMNPAATTASAEDRIVRARRTAVMDGARADNTVGLADFLARRGRVVEQERRLLPSAFEL